MLSPGDSGDGGVAGRESPCSWARLNAAARAISGWAPTKRLPDDEDLHATDGDVQICSEDNVESEPLSNGA